MAPKAPRGKKGVGMDSKKVSCMLGMLKYQSSKGQGERKDASVVALQVYQELSTADDKANFLQDFESNGGGKTAQGLKFAMSFKKSVSHEKSNSMSSIEDYITRRAFSLVCRGWVGGWVGEWVGGWNGEWLCGWDV